MERGKKRGTGWEDVTWGQTGGLRVACSVSLIRQKAFKTSAKQCRQGEAA